MKTWIVLLRGINVGGNRIIRMVELRRLLENLGFQTVRTYIQSGNCVLNAVPSMDAATVGATITTAIKAKFGHDVPAIALPRSALADAIESTPYAVDPDDIKSVYLFFLSEPVLMPDLAPLEAIKHETERFHLTQRAFYLHAPKGIWKSKLAAKVETYFGVSMTARNLRSAHKILALVDSA